MIEVYIFEVEWCDLVMVVREMFNWKNINVVGGNISVKVIVLWDINYGLVYVKKDY